MTAAAAPQAAPPAAATPITRVLELAAALVAAHDRRDVREQHAARSLLIAAARDLPAWPIAVTGQQRIDRMIGGANGYELCAGDDGRVRLYVHAGGFDAAVDLAPLAVAQLRADLDAVLLHLTVRG